MEENFMIIGIIVVSAIILAIGVLITLFVAAVIYEIIKKLIS